MLKPVSVQILFLFLKQRFIFSLQLFLFLLTHATVIFSIWQKFQQPLFYICFQRPLFYNHMLKPVSVQILSTSFFSSSNKDSYIQYSPNYFYQDSYFFLNFFPRLFNIHSLFFSLWLTLGLANYFLMTQTTMR
jgi:hypothetical protein